jgi:dolichyl-phosphate beta-glucosyltransferase
MGRDTVDLTLVVPVRNEESRLPACLDGVLSTLAGLSIRSALLVVDNASTDRSAQIAKGWRADAARAGIPLELTSCPQRGKGAAVRAGMLAATGRFVGFCDADLATSMTALPPALALLEAGMNVVIGSRAHPDSDVSARHSAGRQAGAWLFRRSVARVVPGIGDTQCGFKFFDTATARSVFAPLRTIGFAFDVEVLARAARLGARIVEIPVCWQDVPGSTFSPLRDGWRSFAAVSAIGRQLAVEARTPGVPATEPAAPYAAFRLPVIKTGTGG